MYKKNKGMKEVKECKSLLLMSISYDVGKNNIIIIKVYIGRYIILCFKIRIDQNEFCLLRKICLDVC